MADHFTATYSIHLLSKNFNSIIYCVIWNTQPEQKLGNITRVRHNQIKIKSHFQLKSKHI